MRERELIAPKIDRVPKTDFSKFKKDEPLTSREPMTGRDPLQGADERTSRVDRSKEAYRRRENDDTRQSREPLSEREPVQRIDDRVIRVEPTTDLRRGQSAEELRRARELLHQDEVPTDDSAALEARRRAAAEARAGRERTGASGRDPVVPEVAPVTDADLPGCYVYSKSPRSRVYACTNSTAYNNCLVVVNRDSSVTCKMSKD